MWPSAELGSAVNVLRQVYAVEEWQCFTAKSVDTYTTTNGVSLPGVDPLEISSSALIKDAIDMIKSEPNPTYMHVKKGLLRRYATRQNRASLKGCPPSLSLSSPSERRNGGGGHIR